MEPIFIYIEEKIGDFTDAWMDDMTISSNYNTAKKIITIINNYITKRGSKFNFEKSSTETNEIEISDQIIKRENNITFLGITVGKHQDISNKNKVEKKINLKIHKINNSYVRRSNLGETSKDIYSMLAYYLPFIPHDTTWLRKIEKRIMFMFKN
eukprot:gene12887-7308_t